MIQKTNKELELLTKEELLQAYDDTEWNDGSYPNSFSGSRRLPRTPRRTPPPHGGRGELTERLEQAKRLQDLTTQNEIRWMQKAESAEAEARRLREVISRAITHAGGRWSEWGDRAISVSEILEAALTPPEAGKEETKSTESSKSCNRHADCAKANEEYLKRTGEKFVPINFHCHDEECEDCFGK